MNDAIISICGSQQNPQGEKEELELITAGRYGFENGTGRFTYSETGLTGLEGTETTFTVGMNGVVLKRVGTLNSQMFFREGKKNYFMYQTPFGQAAMGVDTRLLRADMHEHGGELELDYDIDFDHTFMGRNQFKIQVRENNHG